MKRVRVGGRLLSVVSFVFLAALLCANRGHGEDFVCGKIADDKSEAGKRKKPDTGCDDGTLDGNWLDQQQRDPCGPWRWDGLGGNAAKMFHKNGCEGTKYITEQNYDTEPTIPSRDYRDELAVEELPPDFVGPPAPLNTWCYRWVSCKFDDFSGECAGFDAHEARQQKYVRQTCLTSN